MTNVHEALRRWPKGLYPLEAGVELVIHAFDGRFASPWQPWVQQSDDQGWWWIDVEQMTENKRTVRRPQPQPRRPRPRTPPARPRRHRTRQRQQRSGRMADA